MAAHGATDASQGGMDIADQKATFSGFLATSLWGSTLIAQTVALSTLAFAINDGWWAGLAAWVAIGVAVGLFFRMSGAWWATLIASTIILGVGGVVVTGVAALVG
jgi:hypothetical protein